MKNRLILCGGLSLSLLLGTFALWGGLPLSGLTGLGISDILKYWSIPLLLALGFTLFLVVLKKNPPTKSFLVVVVVCAGVLILSAPMLLICFDTEEGGREYRVGISAVLSGGGLGLLMLLWQHQLSRAPQEEIAKILLLSLVGASASYLLFVLLLQEYSWFVYPLVTLIAVLLGLVSLWLLEFRENKTCLLREQKGVFRSVITELRDPLICVGAIACAVALTRSIALDSITDTDRVNIAESVGIIVAALLLYLVWFYLGKEFRFFKRFSILGFYRFCFPLIATALLALSFLGDTLSVMVTSLVYIVFSLVAAFIMLTSIMVARSHAVWSLHVYGVIAGLMYFIFACATALSAWVYYPKNFGSATFTVIVLLVFYILAMSYVALQNRRKRGDQEQDEKLPKSEKCPETIIVDEVARRCEVLTEKHHLTSREGDILLLLAKGRDVPSISKQLFISKNTVSSHSKGVYRKLAIHSKQELLDVLETVSTEEIFSGKKSQ